MTRRRRISLRLIAAALLALGLILVGSTLADAERDERATRPPSGGVTPGALGNPVGTPLWSVRRVPTLVAAAASRQPLRAELHTLVADHEACATVVGDDIGPMRAGTSGALAPASTAKLLTGAAALDAMGPDHHFVTDVVADRAPEDGTVSGDLVLVGGGDPGLSTAAFSAVLEQSRRRRDDPRTDLGALADAVIDAGVRRVEGAVLGDDQRHDDLRFLPAWKPSYRAQGQSGPLGALVVDDGFDPVGSRIAVEDPAVHAAAALTRLLRDRGVDITTEARRGTAPDGGIRLAEVTSAPLADVVAGIITSSDNLAAELVLREVGVATGNGGTTEAGAGAAVELLAGLGVPVDELVLLDGSGLAPDSAATCETVLGAVDLGRRPGFEALDRGLAVAGSTGTLAGRFVGDPLAGRLRAKTGQLSGVVGFAGVVEDDRVLRFALLARGGFDVGGGHALQAGIARAAASYPAVGTDTVPRPDPGC